MALTDATSVAAFQSTHPARGGTSRRFGCGAGGCNFNPPTPRGVGLRGVLVEAAKAAFQSTHPARGGTPVPQTPHSHQSDFNPPTPRGVGRIRAHDLRAADHFNPPTPRGVGRIRAHDLRAADHFNPPTPRGVGLSIFRAMPPGRNFNPPTPRGVGRQGLAWYGRHGVISIHPPREGWDSKSAQDHAPTLLQKRQISSSPAGNDVVPGSHHLHFTSKCPSCPVRTGRGLRVCSRFARPVTP